MDNAYQGVYVPIVTPFSPSESIDYDKIRHNLDLLSRTDLSGIIVLGSNGEFPFLSLREKIDLVTFVKENWNTDRQIIVGAGNESTSHTIELTRELSQVGIDAVLVLPPHYFRGQMTETVLAEFFFAVADQSPVPVVIYNMPANTGVNLSSKLLVNLAEHKNIVGVKDTSGSIVQVSEIVRDSSDDFAVLAGSAGFMLPALAVGATGVVAALGNCMPDECCRLYQLYRDNEATKARELQLRLLEINQGVTVRFGIPGLKVAMDMLGYKGGDPRAPLMTLSDEDRVSLKDILERCGALH